MKRERPAFHTLVRPSHTILDCRRSHTSDPCRISPHCRPHPASIVPQLKFVRHCFLVRPLGATDQRTRLDKVCSLPSASLSALSLRSQFYKSQADVYDTTRSGLLRGRSTMLRISVGRRRTLRAKSPSQRLIWVDVGGGTGAFASFHLFVPPPIMLRSQHRAHGQALSRLSVRGHLRDLSCHVRVPFFDPGHVVQNQMIPSNV